MATQNYPGWGYGIRYKYGMFEQALIDGKQVELPDYWLTNGNPWEVERLDVMYKYDSMVEVCSIRRRRSLASTMVNA